MATVQAGIEGQVEDAVFKGDAFCTPGSLKSASVAIKFVRTGRRC
jgi:hypothetical protein